MVAQNPSVPSCQSSRLPHVAVPYEVDVDVPFVGSGRCSGNRGGSSASPTEIVPVELVGGKGEPMVDADDGRRFIPKFVAVPFGETTARPVPPWTRGRRNWFRSQGPRAT